MRLAHVSRLVLMFVGALGIFSGFTNLTMSADWPVSYNLK